MLSLHAVAMNSSGIPFQQVRKHFPFAQEEIRSVLSCT